MKLRRLWYLPDTPKLKMPRTPAPRNKITTNPLKSLFLVEIKFYRFPQRKKDGVWVAFSPHFLNEIVNRLGTDLDPYRLSILSLCNPVAQRLSPLT